MEIVKWNYFQFRKAHDYPVFVRFKQDELNPKFQHLLNELGFGVMTDVESRKIPIQKSNTRILTVQIATSRLQLQLNGSDLSDKYGQESLSIQQGMPIYTYRKVGIMGFPKNKILWDLAIHQDISNTDQMVGMRILLVRFICQALSEQGVLCYWGTVKDDTVLIMKQMQSFGEAVLIDLTKKVVFSNGGEMKMNSSLKIIRKDKEVSSASRMGREDLISFLSVSTCLLSFSGISPSMKKAIYELSATSSASYAASESSVNL